MYNVTKGMVISEGWVGFRGAQLGPVLCSCVKGNPGYGVAWRWIMSSSLNFVCGIHNMRSIRELGLEEIVVVVAAWGICWLITGLALGCCDVTEYMASCGLGVAIHTGVRRQE